MSQWKKCPWCNGNVILSTITGNWAIVGCHECRVHVAFLLSDEEMKDPGVAASEHWNDQVKRARIIQENRFNGRGGAISYVKTVVIKK